MALTLISADSGFQTLVIFRIINSQNRSCCLNEGLKRYRTMADKSAILRSNTKHHDGKQGRNKKAPYLFNKGL